MTSFDGGHFRTTEVAQVSKNLKRLHPLLPTIFVACFCGYDVISAVTLPFANEVWLGELPLLAVIQLPKFIYKRSIHRTLMFMVSALGMSRGSYSPDYIATHNWAMGIMTTAPSLFLIVLLLLWPKLLHRIQLIAIVLICAIIDGIVTFWFDNNVNLKIFN